MRKPIPILYLFTILLVLFTLPGFSQEDTIKKTTNAIPLNAFDFRSFTVGSGYSQFKIFDKKANQLIYKANLVPVYFAYSKESDNRIFNINVNVKNGLIDKKNYDKSASNYTLLKEIQNQYTTNQTYNYLIQDEINVEYARKLNGKKNQKVDFFVGGQLKQYYSMSYANVPIFISSELSLNPMLLINYHIDETIKFKTLFSFSIASIITNLPYSAFSSDSESNSLISKFLKATNYTTINHYKRININPSFQKQLSDRWHFGVDYIFSWSHYSHINNLSTYDNSIMIKFIKKIK